MSTRASFVASASVMLLGCAYPREPADRPSTIPVYASAAEVPCQFEVMRGVQAQGTVSFPPPSRADLDREGQRLLAREGARAGADAVLLAQTRELGSGVIGVQTDTMPSTLRYDFFGEAIRFLPGTCRVGG